MLASIFTSVFQVVPLLQFHPTPFQAAWGVFILLSIRATLPALRINSEFTLLIIGQLHEEHNHEDPED
jgi:hypothetical protein